MIYAHEKGEVQGKLCTSPFYGFDVLEGDYLSFLYASINIFSYLCAL